MVGIIVFTVVGSQMQLANMTPEEREAYYAEQQLKIEQREQKRQERAEAAQLEKDRRAAEEAERQATEELMSSASETLRFFSSAISRDRYSCCFIYLSSNIDSTVFAKVRYSARSVRYASRPCCVKA